MISEEGKVPSYLEDILGMINCLELGPGAAGFSNVIVGGWDDELAAKFDVVDVDRFLMLLLGGFPRAIRQSSQSQTLGRLSGLGVKQL